MDEKKILGLLSLCKKAGRARCGERAVFESITEEKAVLLLIAEDASKASAKKMKDKCEYRSIPWREFGSMEQLGRAMGVSERAGVAVTDAGFAGAILRHLDAKGESNGKD